MAWFEFFTRERETMIIEMNRIRLQKGLRTDDEKIYNLQTGDDSYSGVTVEYYKEIGRSITAGSHYTMKHTMYFYNSIFIRVFSDYFEIVADEKKDGGVDLFEIYGKEIIGLSSENYTVLISELKKHYLNYARKVLLGT